MIQHYLWIIDDGEGIQKNIKVDSKIEDHISVLGRFKQCSPVDMQ